METPQTKFQTSFVPKKPVIASQATQYRKKSNFLFIISLIIFLATIVFAGGIYAYNTYLKKDIENQRQSLIKANERFDSEAVGRANRLNDRIIAVKTILDKHVSPSVVFALLEDKTLSTVRFRTMAFVVEPQNIIKINATGFGAGLDSIVLQSDQFGKTGVLKDVVFSSVQPNDKGVVDFSFQAKIDPKYLLYSKSLVTADSLNNKDDKPKTNTVAPSKMATTTKPAVAPAPKPATTPVAPKVETQPAPADNNFNI